MRFVFKIILIGDGGVGKTSLIKKYTKGEFQEDYISTIGAQFSIYDYKINDDDIKLFFWDLAGQDDFQFIRSSFYEDSNAAIITYSLEQNKMAKESMKNTLKWYNEMNQYCQDIPIIIFANKSDLVEPTKISDSNFAELSTMNNFLGIYTTSAKTGEGVSAAFKIVIEKLYSIHKEINE